MMKWIFIFFCIISSAQARVFDMDDTRFAGMFNLTYGTLSVEKDYFTSESSATTYSDGFETNMGGEFGFVYNLGSVAWLFGLEIIKPPKTRGTASTGGVEAYKYTADVSAYAPKVGLELIFYQTPKLRVFANGSMGSASITTKTQYTGVTIAPSSDFTVEGKGTASLSSYALGTEMHWNDSTTFVFSVGTRILNFKKIKYLEDVTTFTGGHSKGEQIVKTDGSALEYDFTNYYITLGLRFWIH